eukprot:Skav222798  [mRNA]  locus=scaffold1419:271971:297805:+ [translate_table: standard]
MDHLQLNSKHLWLWLKRSAAVKAKLFEAVPPVSRDDAPDCSSCRQSGRAAPGVAAAMSGRDVVQWQQQLVRHFAGPVMNKPTGEGKPFRPASPSEPDMEYVETPSMLYMTCLVSVPMACDSVGTENNSNPLSQRQTWLMSQAFKRFVPLADRSMAEIPMAEAKSAGGVLLPDSAKQEINQAKVLAVGVGRRNPKGEMIPMSTKVGDTVVIPRYGGTEAGCEGRWGARVTPQPDTSASCWFASMASRANSFYRCPSNNEAANSFAFPVNEAGQFKS